MSELSPSTQYSDPVYKNKKWYESEFSTPSPKKKPSSNDSLKQSHNIFNENSIQDLIDDFIKERTKLQNIYDDNDKTIDYKLNIIKKKISNKFKLKFLSLSKILTLISDVDILISQIDIISNKLETIQEKFATYEIPKLQNHNIEWLDVQLNGYKPDWKPSWKGVVIDLHEKATKLKNKLLQKKETSLQRQTRRSVMSNFSERFRYSRKR